MKERKRVFAKKAGNEFFVHLPDGNSIAIPPGEKLQDLSTNFKNYYSTPIVAAIVDNSLRELCITPESRSNIEFIDLSHKEGMRIYRRSLTFLLIKAATDLFPSSQVMVEHSLGKGLYCEIKKDQPLTRQDVEKLEEKMRELVSEDIPFIKKRVSLQKAIEIFKSQGEEDKVRLLKYRKKDYLDIYSLDALSNYLYGYLVPSTGYLKNFSLKFYMPGLVLRFPDEEEPANLPVYIENPKLFEVFREVEGWCNILGVDTLGTLNDLIDKGEESELMRVSEALHEKKIAEIADTIAKSRNRLRVILIAGPSSSGKTSFAQRLRIQLIVNGLQPLPISLDDYFVDRDKTPKDEKGEYDFESLESIDLKLFNEQLAALIRGEEVEVPTYSFKKGKREFNGNVLQLKDGQPLIIEGIHGLNEKLTQGIPRGSKFKIYVSALTSLNVDQHNRIHTTDTRLLRRMVRDSQFRGHDARDTIKRWPSVRRGEEENIFRFQEEADVMFNSALIYEFAVLKNYAEPLLSAIPTNSPEKIEAKRLLRFLQYFLPMEPNEVPYNSILREFVGESCFFKKK